MPTPALKVTVPYSKGSVGTLFVCAVAMADNPMPRPSKIAEMRLCFFIPKHFTNSVPIEPFTKKSAVNFS